MNKKYNAAATQNSHEEIISQMLDSITLGALYRCEHISEDVVDISEYISMPSVHSNSVSEEHDEYLNGENLTVEAEYENLYVENVTAAIGASGNNLSVSDFFARNAELHKKYDEIVKGANLGFEKNITWPALFDGNIALTDSVGIPYSLSALSDRNGLVNEGTLKAHRPLSIMGTFMRGESAPLRLENEEGKSVATITVDLIDGRLMVNQTYNHMPNDLPDDVTQMIEDFVHEVNIEQYESKIAPDAVERIQEQCFESEDMEKAYEKPLSEGSSFTPLPYSGNGVYITALALEEHLPTGVSFDDVVGNNKAYKEIYQLSEIPDDLAQIKKLAKAHDISPMAVARIASAYNSNIRGDELREHVARDVGVYKAIKEVKDEYLRPDAPTKLTSAQLGMEINDRLSQHFGIKLDDPENVANSHQTLTSVIDSLKEKEVRDEAARLAHAINSISSTSPSMKKK